MGGSSRPKFEVKNNIVADEYLIEWLEKWRVKMGDLKDFVLAGHSFGGYVAGIYACRYYKYIKKLLLLSPAGAATKPEDFNFEEEIEKYPRNKRPPKWVLKNAHKVWGW